MVTQLRRRVALVALATASLGGGCTLSLPPPKTISVPPEMLKPKPVPERIDPKAKSTQRVTPRRADASSTYVVRLAEGGRVWEVELPESAGGYEVRVPLAGGPYEQATLADEELLADTAAQASGTLPAAAQAPGGAQLDVKAAAHKRSYLGAVAKINEMYLARKYELALIELVSLEKEYPQDVRLLSMKGSLYLKLGKPKLAREAWEKALTINPEDQLLTESLRELAGRGE